MKMRIQLIIENESGLSTTAEIAAIERADTDDLIGISLEEAKTMTGGVQRALVERFIVLRPARTVRCRCDETARTECVIGRHSVDWN